MGQLIFEAAMEETRTATILLDDIFVLEGECPSSELSCDFENGLCGYFSDSDRVYNSPWLVGKGFTEQSGLVLGPLRDHSSGSGMYAYVDFTSDAVSCKSALNIVPEQ